MALAVRLRLKLTVGEGNTLLPTGQTIDIVTFIDGASRYISSDGE